MAKFIDEKRYKKVTRKQFQKDKENLRKRNIESRKLQRESMLILSIVEIVIKRKIHFLEKCLKLVLY